MKHLAPSNGYGGCISQAARRRDSSLSFLFRPSNRHCMVYQLWETNMKAANIPYNTMTPIQLNKEI